jgi:hypothetical protein
MRDDMDADIDPVFSWGLFLLVVGVVVLICKHVYS